MAPQTRSSSQTASQQVAAPSRDTLAAQSSPSLPTKRTLPVEFHSQFTFTEEAHRHKRAHSKPTSTLPARFPGFEAVAKAKSAARPSKGPASSSVAESSGDAAVVIAGSDARNSSPPKKSKKKRRPARRLYDDPATTQYPAQDFPPVPDHLFPTDAGRRLDLLVCGLNPGLMSSQHAAHFRHPSNHFYRTLHAGRLTPERVDPVKCHEMLDQLEPWPSIGLTNICIRPTAEGGELGERDYMKGTPILERKVRLQAKPRLMVFTGKGIGTWWYKCCSKLGILTKPATKAKKGHLAKGRTDSKSAGCKSSSKAREVSVDTVGTNRFVSLPVPLSVAWAQDEPDGLGLLPCVIELEPPTLNPGLSGNNGSAFGVKVEDQDQQPADIKINSLRERFCFIFVTTSPSGRVTTMHLPEKGRWMGRVRDALDWLKSDNDGKQGEDMVMRSFEIVDSKKLDALDQ
ncbi:unnamed protein product [Parajaminaea phylloscopi]